MKTIPQAGTPAIQRRRLPIGVAGGDGIILGKHFTTRRPCGPGSLGFSLLKGQPEGKAGRRGPEMSDARGVSREGRENFIFSLIIPVSASPAVCEGENGEDHSTSFWPR